MYRRGFFDARTIIKALWFQTYFRVAGKESAAHVADARETMLSFIAGHTVAEITQVGEEVYEEFVAQRIWPGTRAIAQLHLDAGQQVWLVTAAPVEMAGIIAARLGLTGALGTTAEHDGTASTPGGWSARCCTGRPRPRPSGTSRPSTAWTSPAASPTPTPTTTCRCCRWSATPCAINPDRRLSALAEEEDWQVRDFRTGRRAARLGLLGAVSAGAAVGAVAAAVAVTRRVRR